MLSSSYILVPSALILLSTTQSVLAACTIESGPPQELVTYIQDTQSIAREIDSRYPNICTTKPGAGASFEKVLSTLDKAELQVPIMNNIIADFSYNILTVARFESSPIVIRHGELFYKIEKSSILPTIESLANKCQLDGPASGEIIAVLKNNREIHNYFKNVVNGNIGTAYTPLQSSIFTHYSQDATIGCKDDLDLSTGIERLLKKSEGFGSDISAAKERWEYSLRLIQGGSAKGTKSYNELQTKLLRQELSRQGVGQGAMQQMLKNLECAQADSNEKLDIEKQALSEEKCKRNYIIGLEKLTKILEEKKWTARNSDEYITIIQQTNKTITRESDIVSIYSGLNTAIKATNNADATTKGIIQNLVNIHTKIEGINLLIEKRIPKMKENCMKPSVDIVGGC